MEDSLILHNRIKEARAANACHSLLLQKWWRFKKHDQFHRDGTVQSDGEISTCFVYCIRSQV